jgi:hypothetical protein
MFDTGGLQPHFDFTEGGCAIPFVGFVLFLIVLLVVWEVFLN